MRNYTFFYYWTKSFVFRSVLRILFVDTFSGRCFIVIVFIVRQRRCSQILFDEKGQYHGAWIQQMYFLVHKGLGNKQKKNGTPWRKDWGLLKKSKKKRKWNTIKKYMRRIKVETLSITIWHRVFKLFVKLLKRQGGDKKN